VARTGATVALLNTNLIGPALAHAINVVTPTTIIAGADLVDVLTPLLPHLTGRPGCWVHGPSRSDLPRIDLVAINLAGDALGIADCQPPSLGDRALFIYTSGTTGLPKAASISHSRLLQWSHWFSGMMDTRPDDRMYNCLPMYHSVGGVVATGAVLAAGGAVVVRPRFSASRFWQEVVAWDCTLFQYIGELCRYLINSPPCAEETMHRLRLCCGNGLRAGVWEVFEQRFRIPRILEFYAATEATFSLYNCEGKPGAIGRTPAFLAHRLQVALVQTDADGEPLRGTNGFCNRCAVNEVGEAIHKIDDSTAGAPVRFEGYTDKVASARKVLRNVFSDGDAWYRSGDLMRKDHEGFFYFIDRVGDTFRWKGENVSTTEVAETIAAYPGVLEAVVFGVSIPETEGRAGMAAIVAEAGLDLVALRGYLAERLPAYARPLFLRLCQTIETTGTFKPRKQALVVEGFDPSRVADPLYLDDPDSQSYVPIDAPLFQHIVSGGMRL
jgi:fatty-acyl-CoA synthase